MADKASRKSFDSDLGVGMKCRNHSFELGFIMRAVRDTMVLSPPLTISISEINTLFDLIGQALDLTAEDIKC